MAAAIERPALRYHGGKWKISKWIISHFPAHVCYVEPFAGAASILLRKDEAKVEVLNDLDKDVMNFWTVLRTKTDDLIREIALTPFSREEALSAFEVVGDDLERARRFFIRAWQTRGGPLAKYPAGWRFVNGFSRSNIPARDWGRIDYLWSVAARLKAVQLECDQATSVIKRFDRPGTLYYVDPPYLSSTRSKRWATAAYRHDLTLEDHQQLAESLRSIKGSAVVSGYPSDVYDELYKGWERVEKGVRCDDHNGGQPKVEVLWIKRP